MKPAENLRVWRRGWDSNPRPQPWQSAQPVFPAASHSIPEPSKPLFPKGFYCGYPSRPYPLHTLRFPFSCFPHASPAAALIPGKQNPVFYHKDQRDSSKMAPLPRRMVQTLRLQPNRHFDRLDERGQTGTWGSNRTEILQILTFCFPEAASFAPRLSREAECRIRIAEQRGTGR